MYSELAWDRFMESIEEIKNEDIPDQYRKQFKTKDEFIFPRDRRFLPLVKRVQTDEKLRSQRKWDKECKMFLLWVMIRYFQSRGKLQVDPALEEWEELSQILGIEKHSLKARWITLINPKQKSQNWNEAEDDVIRDSMRQRLHKHIWTQIAVRLYEMNICPCARTPKQVRERWINYLNPNLRKELWLMREDLIILTNVLKKGKRWSYIAKKLEGRTENQVKNRYKSLINKIWSDEDIDELEAIAIYVKRNQSAMNSTKHGMIGKRGRHKACKKQSKEEVDEDEHLEFPEESASDSFSHKKLKNEEFDKPVNMTLRSQRKNSHPQKLVEKTQQEKFTDYQRDFSNYFSQLSQQQNTTDLKIDMLNQAIDQFRIHLTSPQFHRYGNPLDSSLQLKPPHHPFTPDIANNPFLGLEDNMSPFKYRQEEPAQKAQPDPASAQLQQLMSLYQRQMTRLIGSNPPSAMSLRNNLEKQPYSYGQDSAIGLPQYQYGGQFGSALLGSAMMLDFSPFAPKSVKRQEELKVEQFIKSEEHEQAHTPAQQQNQPVPLETDGSKKQLDFLQVDNPIEKYNRRRNISSRD